MHQLSRSVHQYKRYPVHMSPGRLSCDPIGMYFLVLGSVCGTEFLHNYVLVPGLGISVCIAAMARSFVVCESIGLDTHSHPAIFQSSLVLRLLCGT